MDLRATPIVKAVKDQWDQGQVVTVKGSPLIYRRIVGGLAWAGPESRSSHNAICVLGEERDKDFSTGQHPVRVLFECLLQSVEDTLDEAARLLDVMKCASWVTPLDSPESVRVQQWGRERSLRRLPRLSIISPPAVDFMILHNLTLRRTSSNKTMYFGERSLAANQYVAVRPEDYYRPVRVFPHVAACLYALAVLDMRAPGSNKPRESTLPAEGGY